MGETTQNINLFENRNKKHELSELCNSQFFYINFYGKYTNVEKNINFKST